MARRIPLPESRPLGARGAKTQQRIVRAALRVFGHDGYHACRVERITAAARCSRSAFYQYFASKEDLFRHLAGHVARSLYAITDDLEPVTADRQGRDSLREWFARCGDLYDDYAPIFAVFSSAVREDPTTASGAHLFDVRHAEAFAAKVVGASDADLAVVAPLLLSAAARTHRYRAALDGGERVVDRAAIDDAFADVIHRALFGPLDRVNTRRARGGRPRSHRPAVVEVEGRPPLRRHGEAGQETRRRLLGCATAVFTAKGYHDTTVDDIAAAAGLSHGAFYRYFRNKAEVFETLAATAGRRLANAVDALPDVAATANAVESQHALRRWLDRYVEIYAEQGPIIRVWIEAMPSSSPALAGLSRAALAGIADRLSFFLAHRRFGDVDAEAVVLLALLDRAEVGTLADAAGVDAIGRLLLRGFLGVDPVA